MSDIKTGATEAMAGVKAEISKLEADEVSASGWIKGHTAWLIGLGSFVAGLVVMYLLKH